MYSEELTQLARQSNLQEKMERVIKNYNELENHYVFKTSLSQPLLNTNDLKILFGYNSFRFIQHLLYRCKILANGSIASMNSNNALSSLVILRSHYETTGAIAYLYKRLDSYYKGNIDFERMNNDLFRLSLGATTIDIKEVPNPINVMNLIDSVDFLVNRDIFKYPKGEQPLFRGNYEFLSDFCHPNFHGLSSGSIILHDEKAIIYLNKENVSAETLAHHLDLDISLELFNKFCSESLSLIKKNEHMPAFHSDK